MYILCRDKAKSGDDESVDEHARATPPPGPEKLVVWRRRVDDDWYDRGGDDGDGPVVSRAPPRGRVLKMTVKASRHRNNNNTIKTPLLLLDLWTLTHLEAKY